MAYFMDKFAEFVRWTILSQCCTQQKNSECGKIYVFCVPHAQHFGVGVYKKCSRCQSNPRLNSPVRTPLLDKRLIM